MDFSQILVDLLASLIIVLRRFFLLIITPYKTMRKISMDEDLFQVLIILSMVFIYFLMAAYVKEPIVSGIISFSIFLGNFSFTILFFYLLNFIFLKDTRLRSILISFTYSLLPTLIWFTVNFLIYLILPPPRTISLLGQMFSLVFITFSLALFFWKLILVYLALRFSLRQNFYRVAYLTLLYLVYLLPFTFLMYQLNIFRVPFI